MDLCLLYGHTQFAGGEGVSARKKEHNNPKLSQPATGPEASGEIPEERRHMRENCSSGVINAGFVGDKDKRSCLQSRRSIPFSVGGPSGMMVVVFVVSAPLCCSDGYVHIGVLCCQGRYGDLVEEELSLVWTNGRVQLIDRLTPVVLLTQLLQNLIRTRSRS